MKKIIICLYLLLGLNLSLFAQGDKRDVASWFDGLDTTSFLLVDKQKLTLSLVGPGGQVERTFGIACAINPGNKLQKKDHRTPEGRFPINQILDSGYLSHDFLDGKGPIPGAYGPWFLRLDVPGFIDIGIHGTHLPESIGTRATEGCIRMRNSDIVDLKELVAVGMPVVILPDTLSLPVDVFLSRLAGISPAIEEPEETDYPPLTPMGTPERKRRFGVLPWALLALLTVAASLILIKKRHANL